MRARVTLLLAIALVLHLDRSAVAVQASGSIAVVPSSTDSLLPGQEVQIDLVVHNGSTDTPGLDFSGDGTELIAGTLHGPIRVRTGCLDAECSTQQRRTLLFVAGPDAGCTARAAGVVGCSGRSSGEVLIETAPGGIVLPPGGAVALATFTLRSTATNERPTPALGLLGSSPPDGLRACSTARPEICAAAVARGSVRITFAGVLPASLGIGGRITFRRGFDKLDIDQSVPLASSFDPSSESVSVEITNERGRVISCTLPPGSVTGRTALRFRSAAAARDGGMASVVIRPSPGRIRVRLTCYGEMEPATTSPDEPVMGLDLRLGDDVFSRVDIWTRTIKGWMHR
jgi:hypothetical protein